MAQYVPQEIVDLRNSALDFHRSLGQIVVHKHRWNERDVRNGIAQHCPFHSETYERGGYDEYCFGTGYLGGYADGIFVPVTLGDSQEDVFRPNEQGVLIHERHPGLTAPWTPEMGDGDMIIIVEIDPHTKEILEEGDRYELREVEPVTMRGPGYKNTVHMKPFKVNQEAMIDLLPYGHPFYNVPVYFDYNSVPVPLPPDYPPLPDGYLYNEHEVGVRIIGEEPLRGTRAATALDARVNSTPTSETSASVKIEGDPGGTHFNW